MRCPNCGSPVSISGTRWECGWCGDSGFIKQVQPDEPESDDKGITVTISVTENDDESEPEKESATEEQSEPPIDPERAKRLLAAGDFPENEDICREILVGAYPEEIEDFDESGDSPCWNILYDIFECEPEKAIEMWRYLLDIAGDLLKTDPKTAEELLPDWDLFDPPDEYAIEPLFDALSDERFAEQIFGSAYVGSLQPDILRVCFDNGAEELGRRCLEIALANPYLSERRAESLRHISDEFTGKLPEIAPKPALSELPDDRTIFHYCSVKVSVANRPYAYLTGGLPLKVGDIVEVPFGSNNAIWLGEVKEVTDCTRSTAPWSPEQTKTVIRKIDAPAVTPTIEVAAPKPQKRVEQPKAEPQITKPVATEKDKQNSTPQKKPFPFGKLIAAILAAAVIAGIAIYISNRNKQSAACEAALQELSNSNYTSAEQNFSALSGYRDAASLSVY